MVQGVSQWDRSVGICLFSEGSPRPLSNLLPEIDSVRSDICSHPLMVNNHTTVLLSTAPERFPVVRGYVLIMTIPT